MIPRRLLVLFTALVTAVPAVVIASADPAFACSCFMRSEVERFDDAKVVFTGTVTDVAVSGDKDTIGTAVWTFAVDTVYKGNVTRKQKVTTGMQSAACGLGAKPGKKPLVVFAHGAGKGKYTTTLCDGDRPLSEGPLPAEFGEGTAPRRDTK